MKNSIKWVLIFLAVFLAGAVVSLVLKNKPPISDSVTSFDSCASAGYPIWESYPRRCQTPDGRSFNEYVGNELEKQDKIVIKNPRPNDVVSSPLEVSGSARGPWYFEASFPVALTDGNGKVLTEVPAQALSEWMTEEFVPFSVTLSFELPETATGTLRLKKDNPSGLPEYDDALIVPVRFRPKDFSAASSTSGLSACRPTGCSGEICSDEDVISACVYKPEFACFKEAKCERQTGGECGWTETVALKSCLNSKIGGGESVQ